MRSKSHGVTREGKLVQPSVKMERGPSDWGAELVRVAWIEFLTCSSFLGGAFPVVTRVDIRPYQTWFDKHKGAGETRDPSVGNG